MWKSWPKWNARKARTCRLLRNGCHHVSLCYPARTLRPNGCHHVSFCYPARTLRPSFEVRYPWTHVTSCPMSAWFWGWYHPTVDVWLSVHIWVNEKWYHPNVSSQRTTKYHHDFSSGSLTIPDGVFLHKINGKHLNRLRTYINIYICVCKYTYISIQHVYPNISKLPTNKINPKFQDFEAQYWCACVYFGAFVKFVKNEVSTWNFV